MPKQSILIFFVVLFGFFSPNLFAQTDVDWDFLNRIETSPQYMEEFDINYEKPIFRPEVEMLSGEDIIITGYILPLDVKGDFYILSAFPFAACFFCSKDGSAGPASVIELKLKYDYSWFQLDDILTFKGRLKLNDTNPNAMYYILEDAQVMSR